MFAGPNGSGKSTIKSIVSEKVQFGHYVNPDEIDRDIGLNGFFDFSVFQVAPSANEVLGFLESSEFLASRRQLELVNHLSFQSNRLSFEGIARRGYLVSVLCDFLRHELLKSRQTFTFETVMSDAGKVEFLRQAQQQGYRTYLYYVATINPEINVSRVQSRVSQGGHNVPEDKITSRYHRSLDLLWPAIQVSNGGFFFDNSSKSAVWFAETDEGELIFHTEETFEWFEEYVMKKGFEG